MLTSALVLMLLALTVLAGCGSSPGTGGDQGGMINAIDAGLQSLELTGPSEAGAGEIPVFEWAAVDAAARYRLVVLDGSGALLWAWNGAETRVRLGGLPDDFPEGTASPVIVPGSSWSVVAFDAEGKPLAASQSRPVSP